MQHFGSPEGIQGYVRIEAVPIPHENDRSDLSNKTVHRSNPFLVILEIVEKKTENARFDKPKK